MYILPVAHIKKFCRERRGREVGHLASLTAAQRITSSKCYHKQRRGLKITFNACAFSLTAGKSMIKNSHVC